MRVQDTEGGAGEGSNAGFTVARTGFIRKFSDDFAGFTGLKSITCVEFDGYSGHIQGRREHERRKRVGSDEVAVFIQEVQAKDMLSFGPCVVNKGDVGLSLERDFLRLKHFSFLVQASEFDDQVVGCGG